MNKERVAVEGLSILRVVVAAMMEIKGNVGDMLGYVSGLIEAESTLDLRHVDNGFVVNR